MPFCIYADEQMVGFVMIVYGITGYETPPVAEGNYCILRLMIDARYQRQGYGREAMIKILEYLRTFPAGPAQYCWISYEHDNEVAKRLYESVGFHYEGEIIHHDRDGHREQYGVIKL